MPHLEEAAPVRSEPDVTALKTLQAFYDAGRYRDAWLAAQEFPPIDQWTSTPALVLAGRLASNWGNVVLSNRLHSRAYRQSPTDDVAFYYFILTTHSKHGAFEALRVL